VTGRAVPFHCPYCGEEDLRPAEESGTAGAGSAWECADCTRVFAVTFLGLRAPVPPAVPLRGGDTTS
jgi:transposase-like protein